jgi:hypothetical protein
MIADAKEAQVQGLKMIEQKQQLKAKKNAAMAELKLKFLLYH